MAPLDEGVGTRPTLAHGGTSDASQAHGRPSEARRHTKIYRKPCPSSGERTSPPHANRSRATTPPRKQRRGRRRRESSVVVHRKCADWQRVPAAERRWGYPSSRERTCPPQADRSKATTALPREATVRTATRMIARPSCSARRPTGSGVPAKQRHGDSGCVVRVAVLRRGGAGSAPG